jgi:type IV pilus assembly protein PilM
MSVGGSAINRAIATDFGLTLQQAEEYKKVYGVSGKSLGGKIGQATEPILNSILMEVKKSLAFYSQKYKDEGPIRQILLSGGTAKLPGIDLFFANNSGIETAIANPWKVLSSQTIPKEVLDNASDYTIAVGLAMRNYE